MATKSSKNLISRPPVIVVMGHIDHGKSTLLDHIRKSNIVAGEAGGITQHVGAYQVVHTSGDGKKHPITFLDTPGHEAFCGIRERGAQAADIAILAVSAEDGVKPQTIDALKVIKNGKLPYIVAITKIDKPGANLEKAKQSLGENEIYIEGWGGDIPCVAISAVTGEGVSELMDMIMLVAELADLTADPAASATGIIVETSRDAQTGNSATIVVKNGTVSVGSFIVANKSFAPIRYIEDYTGIKIEAAGPSMPARIVGWNEVPECGAEFTIVSSKKEAEKLAEQFTSAVRSVSQTSTPAKVEASSSDSPLEIVTVPLILKADVTGSLDGVKYELAKITHDKVKLKIVSEGVGDINENDVKTAMGDATITIIGFNVTPDKKTRTILERTPVPVRTFKVIYDLTEFVRTIVAAKIPKEYVEEMTGSAKILALFSKEKDKQIIGGKVETGTIGSGNDVRIIRRGTEIGRGKIRDLQEKKQRTREVAEGHEFGMMVEAKMEIATGDRIEAVQTVEKK